MQLIIEIFRLVEDMLFKAHCRKQGFKFGHYCLEHLEIELNSVQEGQKLYSEFF